MYTLLSKEEENIVYEYKFHIEQMNIFHPVVSFALNGYQVTQVQV